MTYEKMFEKVKKALTAADASGIGEHVAVQVNVTGEAEGWFYIEAADGKLNIEPYTYDDRDAFLIASGDDLVALSAGKLALEQGLAEGKLTVDGNFDKFMLLSAVFAQMPVKKTRKPAAKKTEAAEKKPAAKKTAAKTAAKKTEEKAVEAPAAEAAAPAAEAAPAKRKCGRPKKAETAAKTTEKAAAKKTTKKAASKTTKTAKKADETTGE